MLNKFISGLLIGLGISISFVVVISLYFSFVVPGILDTQKISIPGEVVALPTGVDYPYIENFHELPLDDKIANSTAIIVTEISKNENGIYESRVSEILKKRDGVDLYYELGDVYDDYSDYSRYEEMNAQIPKGFIVFMAGNPARMRFSTSYSGGERISSLGDIPMVLFREKCERSGT